MRSLMGGKGVPGVAILEMRLFTSAQPADIDIALGRDSAPCGHTVDPAAATRASIVSSVHSGITQPAVSIWMRMVSLSPVGT
jgi:hypothetical protein